MELVGFINFVRQIGGFAMVSEFCLLQEAGEDIYFSVITCRFDSPERVINKHDGADVSHVVDQSTRTYKEEE